jgi:hypothetical protein
MERRYRERGEGKLGCIIWSIVLLIGGMIAWKAIPVKIASSELYDFMVEQAKFAQRTKAPAIKRRIVERANQLDIPLDARNVTISKTHGRIRMRATYVVTLEFPGYLYDWEFDLQVDRPIFVI